ncbi:MAG: zinc ribbon domain-containing protein [Spirochaetaceae bacterium]|jgi:predicted RNA-binding Zn-ribbon protein involved in translation (DUF1610 family)|nr:zinc ribbon domain-containing protein [Spirochaetaceae bacterium]
MKRARFFCEHCGAEVGRNAKQCPKCGNFFSSILCPSCGFSGGEFLFDKGCPVCGYSAPESGGQGSTSPGSGGAGKSKKAASGEAAGALPWWVYALTALALAGVLAGLFFIV